MEDITLLSNIANYCPLCGVKIPELREQVETAEEYRIIIDYKCSCGARFMASNIKDHLFVTIKESEVNNG